MSKQAAQNTTNQITEGVIWKQLLIFFFPILFGTFFQQLYNTADAIIVGNFVGKEALASVGGSASTIINLLVGFFVGLSSGATVIISQYYGADNRRRVSDSVHTAIALAIAGGVVIMLIGLVSARFALTAMGTPDDILSLSLTYMKIYYLGTIPSMIYNMGSGILRAVGDSKRPLYFLIASCLVNIVLDLLFVAVLDMGVAGAAIATIASQFFSAILTLIALLRTQDSYRLIVSKIRFHRDLLFDIIKIGLPAGLQSAMYSISNLLIQSSINSFGTDTIAAWTAYGKVDSIFWMIMGAYGVSITTFAGQNFGAGKYDRIKKSVRICSRSCCRDQPFPQLYRFEFRRNDPAFIYTRYQCHQHLHRHDACRFSRLHHLHLHRNPFRYLPRLRGFLFPDAADLLWGLCPENPLDHDCRSPQTRGRNSGIFLSTDLDYYIDLVYPLL